MNTAETIIRTVRNPVTVAVRDIHLPITRDVWVARFILRSAAEVTVNRTLWAVAEAMRAEK